MAVTVHKYGVHYRWQIPAVLRDQLWLARNLREDLVTAQHDHEEAIKAVWSSYRPSLPRRRLCLPRPRPRRPRPRW